MTIERVSQEKRPSHSFVSSNEPDEEIDMCHLLKNCIGQELELNIADVFEKELLLKKTHRERNTTMVAQRSVEKDEHTDNECPNKDTHKAELEHWTTVMSQQLGENAGYNQPCPLREKIHLGRSKI